MQTRSLSGELKWIAMIDETHDCDSVTNEINKKIHHGVFINQDVEELKASDCYVSFSANRRMAANVKNIIGVENVESDETIQAFSTPWNLDRIDQNSLPYDKKFQSFYTGKNQDIYILDTGIYTKHNDIKKRVDCVADFINEDDIFCEDLNGHGSHCAGTAAGKNYGSAPEANLKGIKVLSKNGFGSISGIIKALQYVEKKTKKKTVVISMSLGGSKSKSFEKAVNNAAKTNIVVVAAGNQNDDACNYTPASAKDAITVGSSNYRDFRSSFSNIGKCVDIFAPGENIESLGISSPTSIVTMSGTSMATPLVAGIAAQMLQKHNGDLINARADLLSSGVEKKLKRTGKSPNLLAQINTYSGPPTPSTPQPTPSPTKQPPELHVDGNVIDFRMSEFGFFDSVYNFDIINKIRVSKKNPNLCKRTGEIFDGNTVLVLRGGCMFYEKVLNAQKQGAAAVIIKNDSNSMIFNPRYSGDSSKIKIPSCLISRRDGNKIKNDDDVKWGRDFLNDDPPTQKPRRPCGDVTRRRGCRKRKNYCKWNSFNKKCEDK